MLTRTLCFASLLLACAESSFADGIDYPVSESVLSQKVVTETLSATELPALTADDLKPTSAADTHEDIYNNAAFLSALDALADLAVPTAAFANLNSQEFEIRATGIVADRSSSTGDPFLIYNLNDGRHLDDRSNPPSPSSL